VKTHLPLATQERLEVWVLAQDNFMYFKRPAIAYELEVAVSDIGEVAGAELAMSSHGCDTARTWRSLLTSREASWQDRESDAGTTSKLQPGSPSHRSQ